MLSLFDGTLNLIHYLTLPDRGAWRSVALWYRVVDVDLDARIARLVRSRERNQRAWSAVSATCNDELAAGNIELCAARR